MNDLIAAARLTEVDYDPFASPSIARAVPTTEAQREIWMAVALDAKATLAYNESITLQLRGALDVGAMQKAVQALSVRHEALRTTFSDDGQSMLVATTGQLTAEVLDWRQRSAAEQASALSRLRADAVETPFDLATGPLLRAQLVALAHEQHDLVITGHHIVCDGWSFGVLARDLMELYRCMLRGGDVSSLPPADSFADYAVAQLDAAHIATAEADLSFWLSRFREVPPALDLPADHSRTPIRQFASRREDLLLDAALVKSVKAAGAKHGASLFVTMFTTFSSLVARLARSSDVVVGISAAGQAVEGAKRLVGHCVNLLPVRVAVDVEQTMTELLAAGRETILDAYDHQSCTFGALLQHMKFTRDPSRPSLVSVVFNLDSAIPPAELSLPNLQVDLRSNPRHFENFEAFLNCSETEAGVLLELQYNTALFDAATARRWLNLYRSALARLAANPEAVVADTLAPDPEDILQIAAFNATQTDYERDLRLGDLLLHGMRQAPDEIALRFEDRSVSHRELEGLAWGVAAQLRAAGAGPGKLVGVCMERSVELVAALVGTVLSGAAYVPLDPTLPHERLRQMAEDASVDLVVSRASEHSRASGGLPKAVNVIFIDDLQPAPAGELTGTPDDPAYVIFTSGSTGRPKGAMNAHRGIVNRLQWMQQTYQLKSGDRVMQKTPFTFDVSVWEFFWPVMTGTTLVVARPEGHRDGGYLVDLIERERVTLLHFVPSMFRLFLAESGVTRCRSLRQVVCSGEALPADAVQRFFELLPGIGLDNLYGPTEAAVDVTWWPCDPADKSGTVPIGRPIANSTMHVLDERMRPLPIGVPGDLYIGGIQVGMGYVGRPELTAERFVTDRQRPSERLYKTGDLAYWRADGALIYLGRSDFQVKLRGYRIELGEIEASLQQHPGIAAATVVVWSDATGDMRLVAYVVPSAKPDVQAKDLRDYLHRLLPDYMVPQHVVMLPALPLLSSGKVNRGALPAPTFKMDVGADRVAPSTDTERTILSAMEDVLKLPDLGVTDDFFALGGHSLLAARLTARLNKSFDLSMPMRLIFEHSSARALSAAIEANLTSARRATHHLSPQANQHTGPLTVMQERIRFMEDLYPNRVVYNAPSAHRLKGAFDRVHFNSAFQELVNRQPSLRTFIEAGPDGHHQRVLDELAINIPFEDLTAVEGETREAVLMQRMQEIIDRPIDIHVAPLFRVALYRLSPEEHVFLFMPHHIIWDGWSFDLLYQEMSELYPAALSSRSTSLPRPSVSYLDYSYWHREWMAGEDCRKQIDYWRRRFSAIETPRALPTDRPRRAGMTGEGRVEWVHIDKALTETLRRVAMEHGVTLNMVVMAVFAAIIGQAASSSSIVIGIPVRGRLVTDVEPVMGFFNNLLPTHLDVSPDLPWPKWLATVKKELIDAFAHQDVPFERLATEPEISRHAQRSGLYQTLFSFQDARDRQRRWGPLDHSSILVMQKGATEDLGLWLMEVPGGMEGGVNYNLDLFDASTARIFRDRLIGVLRRVAASPTHTLTSLLAEPGQDTTAFNAWIAKHATASADPSDTDQNASRATTAASPSEAEAKVAEIWAELLGLDATQISADDNFFDLGGTSILVMRAVSAMRTRLGMDVDPRRYIRQTIRQLADAGDTLSEKKGSSGNVQKIAIIWARLLGISADEIAPDDNFFDLGGSSILAMQAITAVREELGLSIEPRRMINERLVQLADKPSKASRPETQMGNSENATKGIVSRAFGRFLRS